MTGATTTAAAWKPLGSVNPGALADSRLQLHHAAQIIVSAAISYLPPKSDDSHTNLEWLPDVQALATNTIAAASGLRFALRPEDLALLSLVHGAPRAELPLHGRTLDDAVAWLLGELALDALPGDRLTTKKHYEIPPHPVGKGAPYRVADRAPFGELSRTYHDAWIVTSAVGARTPGGSEPRCWPHHFDLATLITLQPSNDGGGRTIGVGMSPGDALYHEPYFYVGPSPSPPAESLTPLPVGHWHTNGWVGAVLTASAVAEARDAERQRERVMGYVDAAVIACRTALAGM